MGNQGIMMWIELFSSLVTLTWVAGITLAALTFKRHRRKATLAIVAFSLLIVSQTLLTPWTLGWLCRVVSGYAAGGREAAMCDAFSRTILRAVAWGALLAALFVREAPTRPDATGQPPAGI